MIDPDEYIDDPQVRKLGNLPRQMEREWRDLENVRKNVTENVAANLRGNNDIGEKPRK